MLQRYLEVLVASGLIDLSNNETRDLYMMTQKGKAFIEYYRHMIGLITNKQIEIIASVNNYNEHVPNIYESKIGRN
jgi:DNA-binding HxlR family transcriptional regulator